MTVFAADAIRLHNVDIVNSTVDPSSAGFAASIGSLYLRSGTGQAWLKTGAGDTGWEKLVQSLGWKSVTDFGATGDGTTNDTAAVQAAIDAVAAAGGGVVWFPRGAFACTQLTIAGQNNVQLRGSGPASSIKWKWNAATVAGSLLTISNSSFTRIRNLKLDGSALTNPSAARNNHLIRVGTGASPVTTTHIEDCVFTGMVAASGDGVHVQGGTGQLVQRLWILNNSFDGCSRFGVGVEQGLVNGWVCQNYLANCETEIGIVATAAVQTQAITILGNEIVHAGSVRHAVRVEGSAASLALQVCFASNVVLGGFISWTNTKYSVVDGNVQTSGAFASADAAFRVFGDAERLVVSNNTLVRSSGSSAGPVMSIERASGASPTIVRVGGCHLLNEVTGAGFLSMVDVGTGCSIGRNTGHALNAGSSTIYGIDVQAVAANTNDVLIGPGNNLSAAAGTFAAGVRLLANGGDIGNISVVGNLGDQMDYGVRREIGGGGGSFSGSELIDLNNFDANLGMFDNAGGVSSVIRIGANASSTGPQIVQGAGAPEGVVTAGIGSLYLRTDGGQDSAVYVKDATGNTGWNPLAGTIAVWGAASVAGVATAVFMAPGWVTVASTAEIQFAAPRAGKLRNLFVEQKTAGVDAATNTYTVRVNGVNTALTAAIGNTSTGATSDVTHSATVAAGDLISISCTKSGVVTTGAANVTASLEIA